jgi:hypothetical protein
VAAAEPEVGEGAEVVSFGAEDVAAIGSAIGFGADFSTVFSAALLLDFSAVGLSLTFSAFADLSAGLLLVFSDFGAFVGGASGDAGFSAASRASAAFAESGRMSSPTVVDFSSTGAGGAAVRGSAPA